MCKEGRAETYREGRYSSDIRRKECRARNGGKRKSRDMDKVGRARLEEGFS